MLSDCVEVLENLYHQRSALFARLYGYDGKPVEEQSAARRRIEGELAQVNARIEQLKHQVVEAC